jgi:oxidoreductase
MTRQWRVLVVGCGWVSRRVHLPYLARLHQTGRLRALHVADTDTGRAAAAARDFGARPYHGPLADAPADVVVVATPPASHALLAIGALASGAHVIVEKPLALTADDAASVLAASACHGRGVYPLYTSRHRPEAQLIRRAAGPHLGEVLTVHASWLRRAGVPATAGGTEPGVLWDLGSHLADAGVYLAGWTVVSGSARARHTHPATSRHPGHDRARWQRPAGPGPVPAPAWYGVEADAVLTCRQQHGTVQRELRVQASWSAPVASDETRIELTGERGVLVWRTVLGWSPDRQATPGPAVWIARPGGRPGRILLARQPRDPRAEYAAQLDAAFAALARHHADPGRCEGALRSAYASTAVLDAAQASLGTGAPHPFEVTTIPAAKE